MGHFPVTQIAVRKRVDTREMAPLRKEEKDPQQCVLQREERGVWQPRLR